jgi:hypothetical protein
VPLLRRSDHRPGREQAPQARTASRHGRVITAGD